MAWYFWKFVHNLLIHPLLAFPWEPKWAQRAHDWTAQRCKGAASIGDEAMRPLFVSFRGNIKGQSAQGWAVISDVPPLDDGMAVEHLCSKLEGARGYDSGTMVLIGFQRLEIA
jgi:hypothetical protein